MHIQVGDILAQEVGYQKTFEVSDEQPELDDVELATPFVGQIDLVRLEDGIGVRGSLKAAQTLQCHRCLQDFILHQNIRISAQYSQNPSNEQLPIDRELRIDLAPPVREEMILGIPLQQLCKPECRGIDPATGQPYEPVTNKENYGSTKETQNK